MSISLRRSGKAGRALAVAGALMMFAAACGTSETATQASDSATAPAPADTAETSDASDTSGIAALLTDEFSTIDGQTIDLASLQGQDVVLWFWAPW